MRYPIRKIGADEQERFLQTLSIPFGLDPTPGFQERFRIALEQAELCAAFDGDQMVSTFGSYRLNLAVPGGAVVPTAGTTLVTVLPTHRRQGILRSHMTEHFQEANAQGQCLAALWASESNIYGRFGYGPAAECAHVTIEKSHAKFPMPVDIRGSMRLVNLDEALKVFPEVYHRAAKNWPGMFERSPAWWKIRNLSDPEELRRGASSHRRVLYQPGDQPAGYAVYRIVINYENSTAELRIVELIGQDAEAEKAIWQNLFGVDLVTTITHWNLPVDDPLPWWMEQPRELQRKPSDSIWVRPVNVMEALNRRKYAAQGELAFRFRDKVCPWNAGEYLLTTTADGHGHCEKTTAAPQLEFTPFALGAVYLGGHRVRDLAYAGLITGTPEAIHQADALFSWIKKPWCQEIF